jgi:hypothetical protein
MDHGQLVGQGRQVPQGECGRVARDHIPEALEDGGSAHAVGVFGGQVREVGICTLGHRCQGRGKAAELVRRYPLCSQIPEPHEVRLTLGKCVHGCIIRLVAEFRNPIPRDMWMSRGLWLSMGQGVLAA